MSDFVIDFANFKKVNYIKDLSLKELPLVAEAFRNEIIDCVAKNGGHLSSNLGATDLIIALHYFFDITKDKILFDVGHQAYAHKLLTGRSLKSLRQKGGISGFLKTYESPYDYLEAGHSSTSLSSALGMAVARDLNHEDYEVVAVIGDSSISSGLALESINNLGISKSKIIIILNDNEMSISPSVGGLSHILQTKSSKEQTKFFNTLGFEYIDKIDGHDFNSLLKGFKKAKECKSSVVVHVKTIKGKGLSYSEQDKVGYYHGVEPFSKDKGIVTSDKLTWSKYMSSLTLTNMEHNDDLVVISAAMLVGQGLTPVYEKFPTRCFDVGICEDYAMTFANGLSLNGKHPLIFMYSTFFQRAVDQVNHDLARMKSACTIFVDRSGLIGKDGSTHQGIYDEGYLNATPNMTITMPSSTKEAELLYKMSLDYKGPFVIRYPKGEVDTNEVSVPKSLKYGKWLKIKEGQDTCIITLGPILNKLAEALESKKKNVTLINAIFLKPLDEKMLLSLFKYQKIIIYNPYATRYGVVNSISSFLMEHGYQGKVIIKCIKDAFINHATIEEQLEDLKLTINDIIKLI